MHASLSPAGGPHHTMRRLLSALHSESGGGGRKCEAAAKRRAALEVCMHRRQQPDLTREVKGILECSSAIQDPTRRAIMSKTAGLADGPLVSSCCTTCTERSMSELPVRSRPELLLL